MHTTHSTHSTLFILGAPDGEMREIERVLTRRRLRFVHASSTGFRCHSGNAYSADGALEPRKSGPARAALILPSAERCFIECSIPGPTPDFRIDHHSPGDPGYSAGPAEYLEGSSLGQLLRLLNEPPTDDQRLIAAADHCLSAAYAGLCPGIDTGELLFMRAAWIALASGRSLGQTIGSILSAGDAARARFDEKLGASFFPDPTRMPRDLPEGSAYAGIPVIYRGTLPNGSVKEMTKGGTPAMVEAFMERHAAEGRKTYGNPHRGYAGAYFS